MPRIQSLTASRQAELWQQAQAFGRQRRFAQAVDVLQRILDESPDFTPAAVQASYFLSASGRHRDAVDITRQAAAVERIAPEVSIEIGKLLRRFECSRELTELFERVDWHTAGTAIEVVEAARLLADSGQHDQSMALLDLAGRIRPDYAHRHYLRGSLLAAAGDMSGARAELRRTIELSPRAAHAHWMLSVLPENADAADDREVVALATLLRDAAPGSDARVYLGYALHNCLHRLARYDEAWGALEQGMQARRACMQYDATRQAALFDSLYSLDPATLRAGADPGPGSPVLVFIVGMHRSGTSLLERILAGHSTVADGGETHVFDAQLQYATDHECRRVVDATVLARIAEAGLTEVADRFRALARWRAGGRPVLTEKLPDNFLVAGLIGRALPEARILHMRRDPVDTCFSNLRTLFGGAAAHSYDPLEVADYYLHYRRLMKHWHRLLPGRILDIEYSDFVADPEREARRVAAFCGIEFEPSALDVARSGGRVATASLGSVREGILRNRGGAWQPYAPRLQAMIQALAPAYHEDGLPPPL